MDDNVKKLVLGGLLHDIGKVVQRSQKNGNAMTHSKWGEKYLKEIGIEDAEILQQVAFHHNTEKHKEISTAFKDGIIKEDSLAFITYCADNIAAASDRRGRGEEYTKWWFERFTPLYSVFNSLYGKDDRLRYPKSVLFEEGMIPYPKVKPEKYDNLYYQNAVNEVRDELIKVARDWEYFNSALNLLEKYWTFIPDNTNVTQLNDISLYDHVKMTATFGSCMYLYAKENQIINYKKEFLDKASEFYGKDAFILYTLDISGIQKFVYTIHSQGALKTLRGRSFYIEILMQYIIDEILNAVGLSRVNVLYVGGGHANVLMPNTKAALSQAEEIVSAANTWFLNEFKTSLYMEHGYCKCSVHDLNAKIYGAKKSFEQLNESIQRSMLKHRNSRYTMNEIMRLNEKVYKLDAERKTVGRERECKVCHRTENLIAKSSVAQYFKEIESEEYYCPFCMSIILNSSDLLNHKNTNETLDAEKKNKDLYLVLDNDTQVNKEYLLPLPFSRKLFLTCEDSGKDRVWSYCKNEINPFEKSGTFIWAADYINGENFEQITKKSNGIERLGVIRADVDNLGKAFVQGFSGRKEKYNRNTISRKTSFSRMLSLFFKYHINYLLERGKYYLEETSESKKRNATVVYSGGDDLFIVGSWDDIIGFAVDLYGQFKEYTQGNLTISAGIGIYPAKYPISSIARETGELEEKAKLNNGKNSVTVFSEEFTFHWDCFVEKVLGEKYNLIKRFFDASDEHGNTFLHHLLGLLYQAQKPISLARYAFFIAKLEPDKNKVSPDYMKAYMELREKLYIWIKNAKVNEQRNNDENDLKQCMLAVYIYLYIKRRK